MTGQITAQEGALKRGADLVLEARADLDKQCVLLREALKALIGQWAGAGAGAFHQVLEQWDAAALCVISELNDFDRNLRQSEANYRSEDEAHAASMTRLQGRLG